MNLPGKTPKTSSSPSVAIALGAGGARGLAHIHIVEVLDELGIRPVAIAGSSIGSIIGAGMAAGMTGREIREYASGNLGNRGEVMARIWRSRPASLSEMMSGGLRAQLNIERILKAFLPEGIPGRFEDLSIPLQVTATDYFGHELIVFDKGELLPAVAASAAIPALFKPVQSEGRLLVDGGLFNPVPFDLLQGKADIVIAVDVAGGPTTVRRSAPSALDLMFGTSQLMMQANTALKLRMMQPDILLRPPVSRFRVLDFLKVDAVMAETASIKDELKRQLERAFSGEKTLVPDIR
ncbi:MAG: patatin-like phospholipase family protein [Rhizobiaceae bacterium]|nr:patatin-like phospholipase family protein [Rhizobiaceae bacterium]